MDMKIIQECPCYSVTDDGRVWSSRAQKFLKPGRTGARLAYREVFLSDRKNGISLRRMVHRLVAEAFIPNPEGKPEINHKDSNPSNNQASNLEWATHQENLRHSWTTELKQESIECRRAAVKARTGKKVLCVETGEVFHSAIDAAKSMGMSKSAVTHAIWSGIRAGGKTWVFYSPELTQDQVSVLMKKKYAELEDPSINFKDFSVGFFLGMKL